MKIFGLQGVWFGGSICCETAIHFDFIPDLAHDEIDISKTTYASCLIRKRLSPKGAGDYHWSIHNKESDNIDSINQIWEAFNIYGKRFYDSFENYPYPFDNIQVKDLQDKNINLTERFHFHNKIEFAWLLKEINLQLNRLTIANEFSQFGIQEARNWALEVAKHNHGKIDEKYIEIYEKKFKINCP